MSKSDLKIDWATKKAARYAVENWHYSRRFPEFKSINIGVWEKGQFIGVVQFRNGANNNLGSPYGLTHGEFCELSRIALKRHECQVSRVISLAIKFLRRKSPNIQLVVSFADPRQNHHGGVYQASNWIYTGTTDGDTEYYFKGRWHKQRNFRSSKYSLLNGMNYKVLPGRKTPGKHRYLMPMNEEMRTRITPLAKPYPKRPKQAMTEYQSEQRRGSADLDAPNNV